MRHSLKRHFSVVGSTQDIAKEAIPKLDPREMTVFIAKRQTAGRGRADRIFRSPEGGLYMTLAFTLQRPIAASMSLSLIVGLAVARLVDRIALKWPNDLLIDGDKVGGILIETSAPWWLVGIGINIDTPMEQLEGIDQPVTTLKEGGIQIPDLEDEIITSLSAMLDQFSEEGFAPFQHEYIRKSAYQAGESLHVRIGNKKRAASFVGITADGELEVEVGGILKRLSSAEILFEERDV